MTLYTIVYWSIVGTIMGKSINGHMTRVDRLWARLPNGQFIHNAWNVYSSIRLLDSHQEGHRSPRQQAKQWQSHQQLREFFQDHPQKGWQSNHCQLPGLGCHPGFPAFTMPQWTGDLASSQVPQEGFGWQAEEDEWCEPGLAKCQAQGVPEWGAPLTRCPTDIHRPTALSNKNSVT